MNLRDLKIMKFINVRMKINAMSELLRMKDLNSKPALLNLFPSSPLVAGRGKEVRYAAISYI